MTPLQVLSLVQKNSDSYYNYPSRGGPAFTIEQAYAFIDAYIEALRYSRDREFIRKNRGKKPKYRTEDYIKIFLMLGVLRYSPVMKLMLRAAAHRFPHDVIKGVENENDKADMLARFFEGCILSLLFCGGSEYHRTQGSQKSEDKTGQYGYIPSNLSLLASLWLKQDPYLMKGKRFIDIGCGIGDKTIFVHMLQIPCEAYGLEYDYINAAFGSRALDRLRYAASIDYCKLCGRFLEFQPKQGMCCTNKECKTYDKPSGSKFSDIWRADAFLSKFDKFDRLYTYSPISNPDYRMRLYSHIWDKSKPKAEWLEVMSVDDVRQAGSKFGKVGTRTCETEYRKIRFYHMKERKAVEENNS